MTLVIVVIGRLFVVVKFSPISPGRSVALGVAVEGDGGSVVVVVVVVVVVTE